VENIKIRRLGWVDHITRMEDERILRKVFNGKFHITRPLQKPRTNWKGVIWWDISQIL
jgi:hypothetical protein